MKKYLFAVTALVLAIGFSAFTDHAKVQGKFATTDWYPVSQTTQLTTSTTPVVSNMNKTDAIAAQPCKNSLTPVCLVGADNPPALNTPASSFSSDFQIKRSN